MSKSDLQKGNSGLLNNTKFLNGTTTSCVVGDGYDKTYFWVAFPSMYEMTEYDENFKVLLEQVDGLMFDLISHNQNMSSKQISSLKIKKTITSNLQEKLAIRKFLSCIL